MSFNLRLPNLTAPTPEGKLVQMHSFLYQTIEQLNWALNTIETGSGSGNGASQNAAGVRSEGGKDAATTFNEIKALIIKSADIVNAYYEKINAQLKGEYVAQSDFGIYSEQTSNAIEANSTAIQQNYENLQTITEVVEGIQEASIQARAYIKSGLLDYGQDGAPVYGLEIGQENTVDEQKVFDKFARFTADRLSFFDANDIEVAYISDYKLVITNAEVKGNLKVGGFVLDTSNGIALRWEG